MADQMTEPALRIDLRGGTVDAEIAHLSRQITSLASLLRSTAARFAHTERQLRQDNAVLRAEIEALRAQR